MHDLISRQDAIDALDKRFDKIPMEQTAEILKLRKDLRGLPSIKSEQKRGKWIHDGSKWTNRWICSECGYKWFFDCIEGAFCPNCGADMRGEQ